MAECVSPVSDLPAEWPRNAEGVPVDFLTVQEAANVIGVTRSYLRKQHLAGKIQAAGRNAQGWVLFDKLVVLDYRARRLARLERREVVSDARPA